MRALAACLLLALPAVATAECFRTPVEAAAQAGTATGDGFRLDGMTRDVLEGRTWARVRSCAHPEQPAVLVESGVRRVPLGMRRAGENARLSAAVLHAGARVTVVVQDQAARIEMHGTALGNGLVGDRVRVRVDGLSTDAGEQVLEGVVRGSAWVEVVR